MNKKNYLVIRGCLEQSLAMAQDEGDETTIAEITEALKCLEWLAERGRSNP